ncbi:MAG: SDR family oxidoreductase [Lachnospiraceae bacterium]|jgi:3-oxoacyl-[acyl-carrier protein] reductase|nr:SDR family oxidoreductase [Lachnospiraceae bacterium]
MPAALVTGASHGIGRAVADALAADGYDLHLLCLRDIEDLRAFSVSLEEKYRISATADAVDVSDAGAVDAYFASVVRRLDLLVNNAGISRLGLLQEMLPADWDRVIATNLSSVFYTCRNAIPLFLAGGHGTIINISSVWGSAGASNETAYSASKGGVDALTKALAKELAPSHIPVNAIACGVVDTRMNAGFSPEEREALRAEIPADRFASPEEIAAAVVKLAQMPDYMTGQIIAMDGGWI